MINIVEPRQLNTTPPPVNAAFIDLNDTNDDHEDNNDSAIHLHMNSLLVHQPPVMGLLPNINHLIALMEQLGINAQQPIYAYDNEGGNRTGRLFWTLNMLGHQGGLTFINGGLAACRAQNLTLLPSSHSTSQSRYVANMTHAPIADKQYILDNINNDDIVLLDCRSDDEFNGHSDRAPRVGHLPGAVHLDWTSTLNTQPYRHIKPSVEVGKLYLQHGVTPNKEIIAYCHSNNRSAHTYMILNALGYPRVKAYNGGWSEWGNDPNTPIEK